MVKVSPSQSGDMDFKIDIPASKQLLSLYAGRLFQYSGSALIALGRHWTLLQGATPSTASPNTSGASPCVHWAEANAHPNVQGSRNQRTAHIVCVDRPQCVEAWYPLNPPERQSGCDVCKSVVRP